MMRFIAVFLLFLPGALSAYGIKLMRDTVFNEFHPLFINVGIQFVVGLILFVGGLTFIGGFILHRDRKKNLIKKK